MVCAKKQTVSAQRPRRKARKRAAVAAHAATLAEKDVAAYEAGELSAKDLALKYDCARETVRAWLAARGVRIRKTWESPAWRANVAAARERRAGVRAMRAEGLTGAEIAEKIGVSRQRVFQIAGAE